MVPPQDERTMTAGENRIMCKKKRDRGRENQCILLLFLKLTGVEILPLVAENNLRSTPRTSNDLILQYLGQVLNSLSSNSPSLSLLFLWRRFTLGMLTAAETEILNFECGNTKWKRNRLWFLKIQISYFFPCYIKQLCRLPEKTCVFQIQRLTLFWLVQLSISSQPDWRVCREDSCLQFWISICLLEKGFCELLADV